MERQTSVECVYQLPTDEPQRYICALGLHGGRPRIGHCLSCVKSKNNRPGSPVFQRLREIELRQAQLTVEFERRMKEQQNPRKPK